MRFASPSTDEMRGMVLSGLIIIEVLLVSFICLQVYMLGRPPKRSRAPAPPPAAGAGRSGPSASGFPR